MRYEAWIGVRYLLATRDSRRPSVIALISLFAVAVGVAAVLVVLAVHGGFEGDLRNKILGTKAHMLVTGPGMEPLADVGPVLQAVQAFPGVLGASAYVETELMIASATNYTGVVLRGIDTAEIGRTSDLGRNIRRGDLGWLDDPDLAWQDRLNRGEELTLQELLEETRRMEASLGALQAELEPPADPGPRPRSSMPPLPPPGATAEAWEQALAGELAFEEVGARSGAAAQSATTIPGVILGAELMEVLNVDVGQVVDVISPDGPLGPSGPTPLVRRFRVVAVFYTGLYEFDNRLAYVTLPLARTLARMGEGEATGIEARLADMEGVDRVRPALAAWLQAQVPAIETEVRDWKQLNATLFSALHLEKMAIGTMVMFIVFTASLSILCVLIMIVVQKQAEVAILRSMGASRRAIVGVFVCHGGLIGVLGTALGTAAGLGLVLYGQQIGIPLDAEVYYIDRVPLELAWGDVVWLVAGALVTSVLATLYPSMQAAAREPAQGLRYE
jgi:lipoprotein-releasing system permease protein